MSTSYKLKPLAKAAIGFLTLLLSLCLCLSPWGRAVDRLIEDFFFHLRGRLQAPPNIVVVAIDEPSFASLQQQWPWPRSLHAQLIENLFAVGASVVAFDVIFAEPSVPQEDHVLSETLKNHPRVVLAADLHLVQESNYTQAILVQPHPNFLFPWSQVGGVNIPLDEDGFVRRLSVSQGELESLALVAVRLFCGGDGCVEPDRFLGGFGSDELEINFLGPARTVRTVSYYQALDPLKHLPRGFFENKLVFVGLVTGSAIEGKTKGLDNFPIPYSRWGGGFMAGVEIHAHTAHALITNTAIRRAPTRWVLPISVIIASAFVFLFFRLKPARASAVWAVGFALFTGVPFWLFTRRFTYVPVTFFLLPLTGAYLVSPFLHYWQVRKEKNFIRKAFSTYLAPSVVNQLMSNPEELALGGKLVEGTVMFLDVTGFSSLSERTQPEALIRVINRYLGAFTDIVFQWSGMVDKFIGDAVMATWGVPIPQSDHAARACSAALQMIEALNDLSRREEREGTGLRLHVRIGINSGKMIAGNVGGERYFNYTVLGDEVNIASRLEGVNRFYGTTITIGQSTAELVRGLFEMRELDLVRVKGKNEPLLIYELQGRKGCLEGSGLQVNEMFQEGRALYNRRQWAEARRCFEKGLDLCCVDGPCRLYSDRCLSFEKNPPDPDWDFATSLEK